MTGAPFQGLQEAHVPLQGLLRFCGLLRSQVHPFTPDCPWLFFAQSWLFPWGPAFCHAPDTDIGRSTDSLKVNILTRSSFLALRRVIPAASPEQIITTFIELYKQPLFGLTVESIVGELIESGIDFKERRTGNPVIVHLFCCTFI